MPRCPDSPLQKAKVLNEALPYIRAFHGKTFVISFGGHATTHHSVKQGFGRDVAMLQLLGMSTVVVHEGGPQLNQEIVALINQHGGRAVGLNGQAGTAEQIDLELVRTLQSRGFIPVVMPVAAGLGEDSHGCVADAVAGGIAEALKAEKLLLVTNAPGILDRHGVQFSCLTTGEIEALFADGTIHCGWPPKLESALQAVRHGVRAAHVINGRVPGALLLEVLTSEGIGTTIRFDEPHFIADSRRYLAA